MVRFDWYQATVRAEVLEVRSCLAKLAPQAEWQPMPRAPHGYKFADRLYADEVPIAQVWWGGTHAHPHAVVSGEAAQAAAELLRAELPAHSVSRADVCEDYAEPGAYDVLQQMALAVARDRGIKVGTAGDHLVTMKGRTLYLGATSSHTRLRLYDKAEELRGKFAQDPVRLAQVPVELARLEVQVRPQTPVAKAAAAQVDPVTLMGSAAWMRELMRQVSGIELHPFEAGRVWRQSDRDRAYAAVLAQYGGLLRSMAADLGWDCLGLQIRDDLNARDAAIAKARSGR